MAEMLRVSNSMTVTATAATEAALADLNLVTYYGDPTIAKEASIEKAMHNARSAR